MSKTQNDIFINQNNSLNKWCYNQDVWTKRQITIYSITINNNIFKSCVRYIITGQVGLGVGSWNSKLTNAGSIPCDVDYIS